MKQPSHQPPRSQAFRLVAAWALGLLVAGATNAQPAGPMPCRSVIGDQVKTIHTFDPSPDVRSVVEEILALSNLPPDRFVVRAANVENAAAVLCDGEERLLYNPVLFHQLIGESIWTARTILAHELGHLILDHPLALSEPREDLELEADQFAGGAICKLGGTLDQAREAFGRVGGTTRRPGYPSLSDRLAAVATSWTIALGQGACPPSARNTSPLIRLFPDLDGTLVVGPENAAALAQQRILAAERIHFEADLTVDQPLILAAESITFEPTATLRGPKLSLIAQAVEGGTLDASGGPGEAAGRILVAALRLVGTSLVARGGDGVPGTVGSSGTDGRNGSDGRDGKCGPGMLGEFVGSSQGVAGEPGTNGQPGGHGGRGGDGGWIAMLTHHRTAHFADTQGGAGGIGGRGGPGGRGGRGGRGGDGCIGLGGHQPTRPDGPDGLDGQPGTDGLPGAAGSVGRVWSRALTADRELQDLLNTGAGADDLAAVVRGLEALLLESR